MKVKICLINFIFSIIIIFFIGCLFGAILVNLFDLEPLKKTIGTEKCAEMGLEFDEMHHVYPYNITCVEKEKLKVKINKPFEINRGLKNETNN